MLLVLAYELDPVGTHGIYRTKESAPTAQVGGSSGLPAITAEALDTNT